jgi:ech hydrogenase subunit F
MVNLINSIFRKLSSRPETLKYPFVKRELPEGTRGRIDIEIDKCTFCGACEKRCPSDALKVTRDPKSWTLNPYACVICGYCIEVCPKKCIIAYKDHYNPNTL